LSALIFFSSDLAWIAVARRTGGGTAPRAHPLRNILRENSIAGSVVDDEPDIGYLILGSRIKIIIV
jgi:hypothetical protein